MCIFTHEINLTPCFREFISSYSGVRYGLRLLVNKHADGVCKEYFVKCINGGFTRELASRTKSAIKASLIAMKTS